MALHLFFLHVMTLLPVQVCRFVAQNMVAKDELLCTLVGRWSFLLVAR